MLISKLKIPIGLVLAFGLVTLGWGAYQGTRASDDPPPAAKEVVKAAPAPEPAAKDEDDDVDLPAGTPLTQVRVRLDKNGKLVVKTATHEGVRGPNGILDEVNTIHIYRYHFDDVLVTDVKGKKIDEIELAKLLKKETVAMASFDGVPVDPLHLRVLKEGVLVFALPLPRQPAGRNAGSMMGPAGTTSVPRFAPDHKNVPAQELPGQGVPQGR